VHPNRPGRCAGLAIGLAVCLWLTATAGSALAQSCAVPHHLGVAFSLDDSGSMLDSDPDDLRAAAAGIGIDALPDGSTVAATTFADTASAVFDATDLTPADRADLKARIATTLESDGNTDYDEAFSLAATQLAEMATADKRALIFLSDGEPSYDYDADAQIAAQGIPIFAIGFGSAPADELTAIASRSGGRAYAVQSAGEAQSVFGRIVAALNCDAGQLSDDVTLASGEQHDYPFTIGPADGEFRALASWETSNGVEAWITRPDGSRLDATTTQAGETIVGQPTYFSAGVQYPTAGGWALHVRALPGNEDQVHVAIDVFTRTGTVPARQTFASKEIDDFPLATPKPKLFQLPLGLRIVPGIGVNGRIAPGLESPVVDPLGRSFVSWYGGSLTLADLTWHPSSATEQDRSGALLGGLDLGVHEVSAGFRLEPPLLVGSGDASRAAFPIAHVDAPLLTVKAHPGGQVTAELQLAVGAKLKVELYIAQGVVYAGEKLAEGAVGALTSVLSDGVAAPLVIEAMEAQLGYEIASAAASAVEMARSAKQNWNLVVNTALPLATIFRQAIEAEGPALVEGVATYLAKTLKATVTWVARGVEHSVSAVYSGGRWVVKQGGKVIHGAGHAVSSGWHWVSGVFSATPRRMRASAFDARTISRLRLRRLRSAKRLGFGPRVLTKRRARTAARALVKYGLAKVTVRPLLVDRVQPTAGGWLGAAAGRLPAKGVALVELTGPGYRAQRLVRIHRGVAGASLRLPRAMKPGAWTVGIVDYATRRSRAGVQVAAYPFTVKAKKRAARRHRKRHA